MVPLSPSVATASDPAGPSYAAATLQASSATSSASPASKAVGNTSKVRSSDPDGWRRRRGARGLISSHTPQPQESSKGKRKLDLNQEDRKTPSKPSAQSSPPARKRPKCEQIGFLVPTEACAPMSRRWRGLGARTPSLREEGPVLTEPALWLPQCQHPPVPQPLPQSLPQHGGQCQGSQEEKAPSTGDPELARRSWGTSLRVWWWC